MTAATKKKENTHATAAALSPNRCQHFLWSIIVCHCDTRGDEEREQMQHYLEKFVQQEGEPICQHLLRHRLRSARGQKGGRKKKERHR